MRALAAAVVMLALGAAPAYGARGFALPSLPGPRATQALASHEAALVELRGETGAFALQAAGGTVVSPALRLWKVPGAAAARLVPRL